MLVQNCVCYLWKVLIQPSFYQEIATICLIHRSMIRGLSIVDDTYVLPHRIQELLKKVWVRITIEHSLVHNLKPFVNPIKTGYN